MERAAPAAPLSLQNRRIHPFNAQLDQSMLQPALLIAFLSAAPQSPELDACPLLTEPPPWKLNCRIPVHDLKRERVPEGHALIEVSISADGKLLSSLVLSSNPQEVGTRALRGVQRACWGIHHVDGAPSCYRARIPVKLALATE